MTHEGNCEVIVFGTESPLLGLSIGQVLVFAHMCFVRLEIRWQLHIIQYQVADEVFRDR